THLSFFFSSRRRHTRSKRDWSSDVCSSDLRVVRRERQAFYDLIDSTNDETWKTPTACTEWEIRDVVGHLVDVTEGYIERFTLARAKQPFPEALGLPGMAKLLDSGAKRFRSSSRTQLIGRLN